MTLDDVMNWGHGFEIETSAHPTIKELERIRESLRKKVLDIEGVVERLDRVIANEKVKEKPQAPLSNGSVDKPAHGP